MWPNRYIFRLLSTCCAAVSAVMLSPPLLADAPDASPGSVWHYRGRLKREGTAQAGKSFDWFVLVGEAGTSGQRVWFVLEEEGQGEWDWTRAVGDVRGKQKKGPSASDGSVHPSLRYDHATGRYPIELPTWRWNVREWNLGRTWRDEEKRLQWTVERPVVLGDDPVWLVAADTPIGRKRTVWVGKEDGILRRLEETVFMGRGEKYRLDLKLENRTELEGGVLHTVSEVLLQVEELRRRLGVRQDAGSVPWTAKQLKVLRAAAEALPKGSEWPPLERLLARIRRDASDQSRQAGALAGLAERAMGRRIAGSALTDATGESVLLKDLGKSVMVLHFWEYRHTPLQPPYGQVALLDFLQRRQVEGKAKVVGVVVHPSEPTDAERRGIVRSAKKLARFMNLSYELLYDDGTVLAEIGDPRRVGVSLPLFVVIDREGRVRSYHAGFYRVDPRDGLKELEAVVDRVGAAASKR